MLLKTKLAASLLIASALTATPVLAGTEAGDGVIGGQLSFTSTDAADTTAINIGGSYFITDSIELGLATTISNTESEFGTTSSTTETIAFGFRGTYNFFSDSNVVPFVGAGISIFITETETDTGSSFSSTDSDFAIYDVFGGVRFFIAENVALRVELRESSSVDSDDDFDQTTFLGGIELFF